MPFVWYTYLRGLELEGRHPHDVGGWNLTIRRMEVGEGVPEEPDPAVRIVFPDGVPLPPAPKLHPSRLKRQFYYRRIRNSTEAERHISMVAPLQVCLHLFAAWAKPPTDEVIPMPLEGEQPLPDTHAVLLLEASRQHHAFLFRNSWGDKWGLSGFASLSYEYIDKYTFESWAVFHESEVRLESDRAEHVAGRHERRWVVRDEWDRRVYGFEIWDANQKERQGWAFVVERNGAVEVEDLYVRPEFRHRGIGTTLAGKVRTMANAKQMPLRLWVPFADCQQENPSNYEGVVALAKLLGVQFQVCPTAWAAYYATDELPGSESPVEPPRIPPRPKSTLEVVLAAAMAFGGGGATPTQPQHVAVSVSSEAPAVDFASEQWAAVVRRRGELIYKKNRGGLNPGERDELDQLEAIVDSAMEPRLPPYRGWEARIATVQKHIDDAKGVADQE